MRLLSFILSVFLSFSFLGCEIDNNKMEFSQDKKAPIDFPPEPETDVKEMLFSDFRYNVEFLRVMFYSDITTNDNDKIVKYSWIFGDGNESLERHPTHIYTNEGSYHVKLSVTTEKGLKQSITKNIEVKAQSSEVTADFTYTIKDKTVTFNPVVTNSENQIVDYLWFFDNGLDKSNDKSPVFTFSDTGKKDVVLQVYFNKDPTPVINLSKTIEIYDTVNVFFHNAKDGTDPQDNEDYMYFAIRLKGNSENGSFRQNIVDGDDKNRDVAYPRGFEYIDKDGNYVVFASSHVARLQNYGIYIPNYNEYTGFSDEAGTSFDMPFYYGVNNFRVKINDNKKLQYVFRSLNIYDDLATSWGSFMKTNFIRYNVGQNFKIEIPMDTYDPSIHKNIAKLTVDFSSNGIDYPYEITFDGYEPH